MRRIWLLVAVLAPLGAHGASFDCSKAHTAVEKAICADPHLSSLDDQLGQAYRNVLSKADEGYLALRQDQRTWLKDLNAACSGTGIGSCIEKRETERIQALSSGAATTAALARMPPVPPVCQAVIADLNKLLPAAAKSEPGDVVNLTPLSPFGRDFMEPKPIPKTLQSEADANEDVRYHVTVGDATFNGAQVKVVDLSPEPSRCTNNPERYEFWTRDLRTMLGKFDAVQEDDGPILDGVGSSLLSFEGKPYVLAYNDNDRVNGSMTLKAVKTDWTLEKACHIGFVRRRPDVVLTATDADLCDTVAAGQVETVPIEALKPPRYDNQEVLKAKATVDLYNDGHPVTVAISDQYSTGQDHCDNPLDAREEYPVVLNARGAPVDASIQKDVDAEEIRLIRFKGMTYVEGRASADSLLPLQHDVWKMTRGGAIKVCSLLPVRYAMN
jgi:uncharacterized protein YecT (DUF1311 family)